MTDCAEPTRRACRAATLALALFGLTACPTDDTAETSDSDSDSDSDSQGTGGEFECDPVGAIPEVGELVNAPVADDVEVIVKTPQHPDAPGPDNLP